MLKLIFTVCLFAFAAYLPANEQEETQSQDIVQEAFSCGKHKKNKSKEDSSEGSLACGKHKKNKSSIQEEANDDAEPLAFFCPECTDKEHASLV